LRCEMNFLLGGGGGLQFQGLFYKQIVFYKVNCFLTS
jgi:hypothetical protein